MTVRVPIEQMKQQFTDVLLSYGVEDSVAKICAEVIAQNSCDGVNSHGINRFPRLIKYIESGHIDINGRPECISSFGALEQWDGNLGFGIYNAKTCMNRAIALSREHGVGVVGLRNTHHWLRGGAYGWLAASEGVVGICWTNTQPNMPAWGATDTRLGNNPLIMAIPREDGPIVFDSAMTQFSYGKLDQLRRAGEQLPCPGGYDSDGNITSDPAVIQETSRLLPMGYWKGAGLSLVLDLIGALVSAGNTSYEIGKTGIEDYAVSQVFIAIDPYGAGVRGHDAANQILNDAVSFVKGSARVSEHGEVRYPGERELRTRVDNLENGVAVDAEVWDTVVSLGKQ